jgi:hypothetical protein
MDELLGSWQAKKDVKARMGVSVFTIPKGSIVAVTQTDKQNRNVMVEAGPRSMDWMHKSFLDNFEQVTTQNL